MSESNGPIVIVGSINMDLVVRAPCVPAPGQTVLGRDFTTIPGGKGANQAVAVARLGGNAVMVGRVGDDDFGSRLRNELRSKGVNDDHVLTTPGVASGIAMIVVEESGENAITVASGANFSMTPADVDAAESVIARARVCLLQLELPVETVLHTIDLCRRHGVETILDTAPAPVPPTPDGLFSADIVTPNESEAAALTGLPVDSDPADVAAALRAKGCRTVVLKLGQRGSHVFTPGGDWAAPGFKIEPVDTTAAGDAFTAALAVARATGQSPADAARFANAAGALACTKLGAQPSMPTGAQVNDLMRKRG
jgi:ribokinase